MVAYYYDSNAILVEPLQNHKAQSLVTAWETLHNKIAKAGTEHNTWVKDNECSAELKLAFKYRKVAFLLVPPHSHRRNLAERAIQTFKNHFVAGLASVDPDFPLGEWDRLLKQAEITINMLRGARVNPKLSAYAYLFGQLNYNATPMAPPRTRVVAHANPSTRSSWDPHGQDG